MLFFLTWQNRMGLLKQGLNSKLDKTTFRIVHLGPSLLSVPVKLTPFALNARVLEQVLSWLFRQALDDGELKSFLKAAG